MTFGTEELRTVVDTPTSHVGIPGFESLLYLMTQLPSDVHPKSHWVTAQVLEFLPPILETWIESLAPAVFDI